MCASVDNNIYGQDFLEMTREDIAVLIPDNFVLGMKLYKVIMNYRQVSVSPSTSTSSIDNEDSDMLNVSQSSSSSVSSTMQSLAVKKRASAFIEGSTSDCAKRLKSSVKFSLPMFSEDVQRCIDQDAVLTTQQRNKIIRECCRALQGHCRQHGQPVSSDLKRFSAKLLSQQCPNSLGKEVYVKNHCILDCFEHKVSECGYCSYIIGTDL